MPQVTLIHYTGRGHLDPLYAAKLLAFTKETRLQMTPGGFDQFMAKPATEVLEALSYMSNTIPSSWEFVDVVFLINNLSRTTAQQVTRSREVAFGPEVERKASFAMQSQRVTDMSDVTWDVPPGLSGDQANIFNTRMDAAVQRYSDSVIEGMSLEDARDLLPGGVHCNLVAKYNFRTFVEMIRARESLRVQGPYVSIVQQMKAAVLDVWPWAEPFFVPKQQKAIALIEAVAFELKAQPGAVYAGPAGQLAKAADLLKGE
jgi:hypothetical protein